MRRTWILGGLAALALAAAVPARAHDDYGYYRHRYCYDRYYPDRCDDRYNCGPYYSRYADPCYDPYYRRPYRDGYYDGYYDGRGRRSTFILDLSFDLGRHHHYHYYDRYDDGWRRHRW